MGNVRSAWISGLVAAAVLAFGMIPAHAADEPIVLIGRFYVTPGQEAAFEERNLKVVEFVRKAEPTIIYRLQRSAKDPSLYVYYEVYPSQTALDYHSKVTLPAFVKEFGPRPEGMLARPPEIEKFQALEK